MDGGSVDEACLCPHLVRLRYISSRRTKAPFARTMVLRRVLCSEGCEDRSAATAARAGPFGIIVGTWSNENANDIPEQRVGGGMACIFSENNHISTD